jgi:hypothetical protein
MGFERALEWYIGETQLNTLWVHICVFNQGSLFDTKKMAPEKDLRRAREKGGKELEITPLTQELGWRIRVQHETR